jgi:hypothetical protein
MAALDSSATVLCAAGCGKPASAMSCPTCKKLGVTPLEQFCGQSCFEAYWPTHKAVHKVWKDKQAAAESSESAPPVWAKNYGFTGSLRPFGQSTRRKVIFSLFYFLLSIDFGDFRDSSFVHVIYISLSIDRCLPPLLGLITPSVPFLSLNVKIRTRTVRSGCILMLKLRTLERLVALDVLLSTPWEKPSRLASPQMR